MLSKFLLFATFALAVASLAGAGPPLQYEPSHPHRFEERNKGRAEMTESVIQPRYRLPGDVMPVNYHLQIRPVLTPDDPEGVEQFRMPGKVRITVECIRATNVITMNAAELEINQETVTVTNTEFPDQRLNVVEQSFDETESVQSYEITLADTLTPGTKYDVIIEFEAQIADPAVRMNGVYRSSYVTAEGDTRYVATTQFSRTRALRKTFPSFDEPNQKATFEFVIGRTAPYHTLSNMDLDHFEPNTEVEGWFWDFYPPTVTMPGTVIAFVVSDFAAEDAPDGLFDKPVKIWGPPPALRDGSAEFAAKHVAKVLHFFGEHFGIEYEFPKMDSVGMPDFAAGAMENWGLNIYRTTYMFWYRGENTMALKYSIGDVVAHELAHQWWGNLVTHAWWNDWWLTEGFASYFEYLGLTAADTDSGFEAANRIVCDDIQPAMDFDAGPTSVPIHGPISDQFIENPSVINYQKGASIIRMMQGFLGEAAFIGALKHYLNERRYTAVHQDALFDDMTQYLQENGQLPNNGRTMTEIMDTWTLQPGFPLLRVSRGGPNTILVSQERFKKATFPPTSSPSTALSNHKVNATATIQELGPNDLWYVPVGYVSGSNPDFSEANLGPKFWVNKNIAITTHSGIDTNQWLVLNGDARGYYRVLYDNHFETLLQTQLRNNYELISTSSRSQLMDDYFTMAYQSYIRVERALEMSAYLEREREYVVWVPVFKHLRPLATILPGTGDATDVQEFHTYVKTIVDGALQFLSGEQVPDEPAYRTITRVPVLDWACTANHVDCIASAVDAVEAWKRNPAVNLVPVDIQATVYCTAVAHANEAPEESEPTWDFLLERFREKPTDQLMNALACSNEAATLSRILTLSITDGSDIPKASAVAAIQRVAMNSAGRGLVLQFLEDRMADIIEYTSVTSISSIVSTLSQYTANSAERTRLADFITANSQTLAPIMQQLNQSLGIVDQNILWMDIYGHDMVSWFRSFNAANN